MTEQKIESANIQRRFLSLRLKVWIGFILIFTPVFIASYYFFYLYTTERVFHTITEALVNTITGAAQSMDKDAFLKLYQEESTNNPNCPPPKPTANTPKTDNGYYPEDNPLYIAHENWLRQIQEVQPDTRIYTYIRGPDAGEIIAIGSTGYFRSPRGGFRFCQRYTSTSSRIYDGLSGRVDSWNGYTDTFGTWITTYMPITDANGNNIGAIGVDIKRSYVDEVRTGILTSGAIAFVLSYVLIFFLVYWLSGSLTRPIISLAGAAKQIGEGDYSTEIQGSEDGRNLRDEIDTLTEVFRVMVDKVAQRERNLRARVHQLEIMVDKSKLANQVQEIVESDFFQDLQSKVKGMRDRFHKEDE